ncbi:MAG: hypothetical protein AAF149_17110 [Bacteroidota bacterium]
MMKTRILKFLTFSFIILLAISCGDDDGEEVTVTPGLEDVEFTFSATEPPIDIQTAPLLQSSDPNANQVGIWISQTDFFSSFLENFQAPAGAAKSTTPIGGKSSKNGRTQEDVIVYTYTISEGGTSISVAYQISETSTSYVFEIFWKFDGTDYVKFIHAEESKDELRDGFMDIFAVDPGSEEDEDFFLRYEWSETAAGLFTFKVFDVDEGFRLTIVSNPDNSGSLTVEFDGILNYEATWNSAGTAGTYATYDFDGNLISTGTWEI